MLVGRLGIPYMYIHIYIYIYDAGEPRERLDVVVLRPLRHGGSVDDVRKVSQNEGTANLPTNIVDFRGFDSSVILI